MCLLNCLSLSFCVSAIVCSLPGCLPIQSISTDHRQDAIRLCFDNHFLYLRLCFCILCLDNHFLYLRLCFCIIGFDNHFLSYFLQPLSIINRCYCLNFQTVSFWFGKFSTFCFSRFFQALYTLEKMARNVFSDTNLSYGSWEAIQIGAHYHLHISHKSM